VTGCARLLLEVVAMVLLLVFAAICGDGLLSEDDDASLCAVFGPFLSICKNLPILLAFDTVLAALLDCGDVAIGAVE